MKLKTTTLLRALHVVAWVMFIGLMIRAGAVVTSYIVSIGNPVAAKDLYMGMDLSLYRDFSFPHYTLLVLYKVLLFSMQAYIAYLITSLLSKINISKPFSTDVAGLMQKISYAILG